MSLLREIQELATNSTAKLTDVLRKAKVLAARLGHGEFKRWVECELNGYPNRDAVPAYRVIPTPSFGNFYGAFGSSAKNAPIPMGCIPEKFHNLISHVRMTEGVSYYEELLGNRTEKGTLQCPWNADLTATVGDQIYKDMNCVYAWQRVSDGSVASMLDTVRNKLLDFALEIEVAVPDAGEATPGSRPVPPETVNQIFNTYIMGGSAVVGGSAESVQIFQVTTGSLDELKASLAKFGVDESDRRELEQAIMADPKPTNPEKLGGRVSGWIGKMVGKASSGAWTVSVKIAGDILSRMVCSYYGLK